MAVVVVGVVAFARIRRSGFHWDLFYSTLSQIHLGWFAAGTALVLASYLGRVIRWRVMMRPVCAHPSFLGLLSATVIGFTAVVFFGRPGELVRPYLIATKEQVPFSSQVAAWLVERIYDLLMVLLLFGFALTQMDQAPLGPNLQLALRTGGYAAALLGVGCVAVLILSASFEGLARRLMKWFTGKLPARLGVRLETMFDAFMRGMAAAGHPRVVVELAFYSALEWAVILGAMYCLLRAYPATGHFGWIDNLVFTGFIAFGSAVQVPGIGGGMQVAAVIVLTELFNLNLETATGMALFIWAATWLTVVPFGLGFAFHQGVNWRQLRHIQTTEPQLQS